MELSAGEVIRIGSRKSRLAVMQAELIRTQIECAYPEIRTELVTMKTTGDKILDKSLETIGGEKDCLCGNWIRRFWTERSILRYTV